MTGRYDTIDLAKFLFSILIVALHASALYDISPSLNLFICEGIGRLGVPFFFVTSAFFFFSKPVTWDNTKKYCKRLAVLYVVWFIISLPKTVFDRIICSTYPLPITIFRLFRSFFVTSTFSGSWFIVSCIWCALLFYCLEQLDTRKRHVIIVIITITTYLWITFTSAYGNLMAHLGMDGFYKSYEMLFANPYLSFLVGIPYFAVGRFFRRQQEKGWMQNNTPPIIFAGLSFCILLLMVEVYFCNSLQLAKSTDCYLMLLPCIVFLFPLLLNSKCEIPYALFLRKASTIVFFSQFLLLFICEIAEWAGHLKIPCIGKFLFASIFGIFLTIVILRLQRIKGFAWLRLLY